MRLMPNARAQARASSHVPAAHCLAATVSNTSLLTKLHDCLLWKEQQHSSQAKTYYANQQSRQPAHVERRIAPFPADSHLSSAQNLDGEHKLQHTDRPPAYALTKPNKQSHDNHEP